MASKNLLPVVALCGALATGTPVAGLGDSRHGRLLTSSPKFRSKSVEHHCVRAFFDRTGRDLNLGMPSS